MPPPPAPISVTIAATPGDPAATYLASFSANGTALGAWPPFRFSALKAAHNHLPLGQNWPEFPPLHVFSNMRTDAGNVARRGGEVAA